VVRVRWRPRYAAGLIKLVAKREASVYSAHRSSRRKGPTASRRGHGPEAGWTYEELGDTICPNLTTVEGLPNWRQLTFEKGRGRPSCCAGEKYDRPIFERPARHDAKQIGLAWWLPLGAMLGAIPLAMGSKLSSGVARWLWGFGGGFLGPACKLSPLRACALPLYRPVLLAMIPCRCWAMGPACFAWEQGWLWLA